MSKQHDRITQQLHDIGAAWAVRSDKFCDANDSLEAQQAGRKTYHVHPDREYPHQSDVIRFGSLRTIENWINDLVEYNAKSDQACAVLCSEPDDGCQHCNIVTSKYIRSCKNAGCISNGPSTEHFGCGVQVQSICRDCGVVLCDSAKID